MKSNKSIWGKMLSVVMTMAMVMTWLVFFIPTALAVADTSVISSATFQGAQAGPAALDVMLLVNFTEPVCGNADCSAGLTVSNFTFTDGDSLGFGTISSVEHTAGNNWARLTMNQSSTAADTGDTIRAKEIYTASGMLLGDSSTVHDVALTSDVTAPTVTTTGWKNATTNLLLGFSEPVSDEAGNILALADFTYTEAGVAGGAGAIDLATVSLDRRWLTFSTDVAVAVANDNDDTLTIGAGKLYDLVGNQIATPVPGAATTLTNWGFVAEDSTAPAISSAYGQIGNDTNGGNDLVLVNFSEPVFSANDGTGDLVAADFSHSTATISGVLPVTNAGSTVLLMDLDANQTALGTIDSENNVDVGGADNDVYDAFGNALTDATAAVAITDNTMPVLLGVWINQFIDHCSADATAVGTNITATAEEVTLEATVAYPSEGAHMLKMVDATALAAGEGFVVDTNKSLYDSTNSLMEYTQVKFDLYWEDTGADTSFTDDGDLAFIINETADFTTASEWFITTDVPDDGTWTTVTVDLTADVRATTTALTDLHASTDPEYWGIKVVATDMIATNDVLYIDNVRFSRGASSKSNQIVLEYSESVDVTGDPAEGWANAAASAATAGDMTDSGGKTLAGFGAFAAGKITTPTTTNTIAKSTNGRMYEIDLADRAGGIITQTSANALTLSGLFTPTANVTDIATNAVEVTSTHTPETVIDTLDLTTAATAVTDLAITQIGNATLKFVWDAPSQTAATFSHYVVTYGTSTGVTVASTLWDDASSPGDTNLTTSTLETTTVSGLTNGTTYYANVAAVDTKGISTSLATEVSAAPSGSTSNSGDTTGPSAPSNFAASVNEDEEVVLTWTDPTSSDFENVQIVKSVGEGSTTYIVLGTVGAEVETYTDTDVSAGDIVNYKLRAFDNSDNAGTYTNVVTITVEVGAEVTAEDVEEDVVDEGTGEEGGDEGTGEEGGDEGTGEEGGDEGGTEGAVTFPDVEDHWAAEFIAEMAGLEIVYGDPEGTFRPNDNLNRAEAAALLHRVLGLGEPLEVTTEPFLDVPVDAWYAGYVNELRILSLVNGNPDGTYQPGESINRAEFLVLAMNVYEYIYGPMPAVTETGAFVDLDEDAWYAEVVNQAAEMGFVNGSACTGGKCFNAGNEITRAEATVMLYNMFLTYLTVEDEEVVEEEAPAEEEPQDSPEAVVE